MTSQCNFDSTRPCGTKTRASGRYTRADLDAVAALCGIKNYKKKTMDELCDELRQLMIKIQTISPPTNIAQQQAVAILEEVTGFKPTEEELAATLLAQVIETQPEKKEVRPTFAKLPSKRSPKLLKESRFLKNIEALPEYPNAEFQGPIGDFVFPPVGQFAPHVVEYSPLSTKLLLKNSEGVGSVVSVNDDNSMTFDFTKTLHHGFDATTDSHTKEELPAQEQTTQRIVLKPSFKAPKGEDRIYTNVLWISQDKPSRKYAINWTGESLYDHKPTLFQ